MQRSTWNIECGCCAELTNVECEQAVQPPQCCSMCGSGNVTVEEDSSETSD
ncbi:rubredoxin-type fold protein [Vibrio phage 1.244.A._10N.261.54.C3]|nr:rubredoxin-type fold protein [Vibrio phage 1.244.A._10N.261.54.C3]AUR98692.1 rubredoxin-type fold protein [Vibrio phage 1.255.O._10N.286.45.F1]